MKTKSNNITTLILNNNQISWRSPAKQTQNIREKTNQKINQLGNKYFDVKNKLNALNIHRDILFMLAKELFQIYKDQNKNIHFQSQIKRSKDALICWFAEYFYSQIFDPKSYLMKRLIYFENQYFLKNSISKINPALIVGKQLNNDDNMKYIIDKNINIDCNNHSIFNEIKINKEIDNFEFSNISKDNIPAKNGILEMNNNNNFDYYKVLDF